MQVIDEAANFESKVYRQRKCCILFRTIQITDGERWNEDCASHFV